MKQRTAALFFLISVHVAIAADAAEPRTSFQTWRAWTPGIALPTDGVMVYSDDPGAMRSWAERGYEVWSMFGASWLSKDADVVRHHPEIVQTQAGGVPFEMIAGRAWVVPTVPWREYIKERVGRLIANGTRAILPEEPEYFAGNGYSAAFKAEWKRFYGEPWRPPHASVTNLWKANRLKAHLFTEFFRDVFAHAKSLDPTVLCIVPAHSNLNYAHWGIVAPHHAFASIPQTDGFVAQVWTGTAKGALPVGGRPASSVFDYAFLEYSYFANLVAGTQQRAWFLADPVEDAPGARWDSLRRWYEDTVTAAMLHPVAAGYEVAPWPDRFLMTDDQYGGDGGSRIPEDYATELMVVWAAQRAAASRSRVRGAAGAAVGALTADTLMWQRGGVGRDRFAGHAAPMLSLIRNGVRVEVLPAERFAVPEYAPPGVRMLVASFDAWKPESPQIVAGIARWVESGGTLLFYGGTDDYDAVEGAWWRGEGRESPADELLAMLLNGDIKKSVAAPPKGLGGSFFEGATARRPARPAPGAPGGIAALNQVSVSLPLTFYGVPGATVWMKSTEKPLVWKASCGNGTLVYAGFPGEFIANQPEGETLFLEIVRESLRASGAEETAFADRPFIIDDGRFIVGRALKTERFDGPAVNLFRPNDGVRDEHVFEKGENIFLLTFGSAREECGNETACIVLAGGNVSDEKRGDGGFEFTLRGPEGRTGVTWIYIGAPAAEDEITVTAEQPGASAEPLAADKISWHERARVLQIAAPLDPDGTRVKIKY